MMKTSIGMVLEEILIIQMRLLFVKKMEVLMSQNIFWACNFLTRYKWNILKIFSHTMFLGFSLCCLFKIIIETLLNVESLLFFTFVMLSMLNHLLMSFFPLKPNLNLKIGKEKRKMQCTGDFCRLTIYIFFKDHWSQKDDRQTTPLLWFCIWFLLQNMTMQYDHFLPRLFSFCGSL